MAEWMFFCGTDPPARSPKSSKILRNLGDDPNVKIERLAISAALVQQIPKRLLDLLDIASYVFAADRLSTRGGSSGRGMGSDWYRKLRFRIAVRDPPYWSSPELVLALKDLLGFMSGDDFSFEFEKLERAPEAPSYFNFGNDNVDGRPTAPVILFSGGLDSLAGTLEELSSTEDRVVLITHRSSPTMAGCQNNLAAELRRRFRGRILHVPLQMTLSGGLNSSETSQRTRTFLFSAIAGSVASMLGAPGIRFYENGIMNLNLPISPQVVGTAATRSTHPRTLSELSVFLGGVLGGPCAIDNPFDLMTKAEVLEVIKDRGFPELIASTISCTKIRERIKGKSHCGACVQCLHRRFATLAAELAEHDPAERYALDLFTSERDAGRDRTMAIEFVRSAREYLHLTDEGFVSMFSGELSRLVNVSAEAPGDDLLRALFDLHRRHGEQVASVLKGAIDEHKDKLSRGTLPPGCLLSCVLGAQGEIAEWLTIDQQAPPPQTSIDASDVVLAIDQKRKQLRIQGMPPIEIASGVEIMLLLAKQHESDTRNKRVPVNFSFVPAAQLEEQLGISNDVLRRRIERLREKLSAAFLGHLEQTIDRELIVESRQWRGYRLNPRIRFVALDELKKPDRHNTN